MANDLTGDYDAVAAFSLGAVNRILAAMHRGKRLPHSLSMAVDDSPAFRLGAVAVSVEDKHGAAVTDAGRVKLSALAVSDPRREAESIRTLDPVVNWRPDTVAAIANPPALSTDSDFVVGVAQLQLGPPTMQLLAGQTDRADIHTPAMIQYHPDQHTRPLSPFMRGEIVTSFGVKEVRAPAGARIVVDVAGPSGSVKFNLDWSDLTLGQDDELAIKKVLAKALKQSFKPSSTPVPAGPKKMHFKGFPAEGAVAVMMNLTSDEQPSRDSITSLPLRPQDHFVLAVNGDAITVPFATQVNAEISAQLPGRRKSADTTIHIKYGIGTYTFHILSAITVGDATVQLIDLPFFGLTIGTGEILLTIPVHVGFGWQNKPDILPDPVSFDFTIVQAFTLTLNGRRVGIEPLGSLGVNIPANVPEYEAKPVRDSVEPLFKQIWKNQSNGVNEAINTALTAETLQTLVEGLMNPQPAAAGAAPGNVRPELNYTRFKIQPSGIILHGALAVPPWPDPSVEFDKDPWAPAAAPEYRALNSWIPGGTIEKFQWSYSATNKQDETDRFVTVNASAMATGNNNICLRLFGRRITAAGPVSYEAVDSVKVCKLTGVAYATLNPGLNVAAANRPHVIVPQPHPGPEQRLEARAHISPWAPDGFGGGGAANLVVHFPDDRSARELELLLRALGKSARTDTETAILCVLSKEQFSRAREVEGLLYADDAEGWERLMGVRERPATLVLSPSGETVWRHQGEIEGEALTQALRRHLSPGGQFYPQFIEPPLRIGELSPNFVFESSPGERLTLRDLAGRQVALVFWRDWSAPSLATLRNLHRAVAHRRVEPGDRPPLIVAIDDGTGGDYARGLATADQSAVVTVADPEGQIARAYGVNLWPTVVSLDPNGLVQDIRLGLITEQELEPPVTNRPAALNQPKVEC